MRKPFLLATGSIIDLEGIEWIQALRIEPRWAITFKWKSGNVFHDQCTPEVGEQLIKALFNELGRTKKGK